MHTAANSLFLVSLRDFEGTGAKFPRPLFEVEKREEDKRSDCEFLVALVSHILLLMSGGGGWGLIRFSNLTTG